MSVAKRRNRVKHEWLADAIARHLAVYVSRYRVPEAEEAPQRFEGLNETALVILLSKIFDGLGFATFYEQKVYDVPGWRLDLWAEELDANSPRWLLEAKVIWDEDQRLGRSRFTTDGEILGDMKRLSEWSSEPGCKLAIWVAFSATERAARATDAKGKLRLQDAVDAVTALMPAVQLACSRSVGLEPYGPCDPSTRFAHIYCWEAE